MMNLHTSKIAALAVGLFLAQSSWMQAPGQSVAPKWAGSIAPTGNMTGIRFSHAAVLLPDGRVLVVGGIESNGVMQPTAELFDPANGKFIPAGKLQSPHGWGVTGTLLQNGKVLIAGGSSGCDVPCYSADAELYDPSAGAFIHTGRMMVPRAGARSLLLPSGDVLFVGGSEAPNSSSAATAELYHVSTGRFSPAGATHLSDPCQLVLLKNHRVLVVGESGADLYDPSTGQFTPTGKMTIPRSKFGAAMLPDGRVLIVGGQSGGPWGTRVTSSQIYDPARGTFAPGPELNLKRFKLIHAVVPLNSGRILVAGGADQPEVYDPASGIFLPVSGAKLDGFCFSTATVLNDGRVLLAGGYASPGGRGVNHAWLYQP
ncbi:MAG TPA: kelch repeat-containing protein [Candidatus Angelobacter sp.]